MGEYVSAVASMCRPLVETHSIQAPAYGRETPADGREAPQHGEESIASVNVTEERGRKQGRSNGKEGERGKKERKGGEWWGKK